MDKPPVPDHTVIAIPAESAEEATYVSALLNSAPAQLAVTSYVTLHPSPHVLEHVAVPKYDAADTLHERLATHGAQAQALATGGESLADELRQIEREIDLLAAALWGISEQELAAIQKALAQYAPRPK